MAEFLHQSNPMNEAWSEHLWTVRVRTCRVRNDEHRPCVRALFLAFLCRTSVLLSTTFAATLQIHHKRMASLRLCCGVRLLGGWACLFFLTGCARPRSYVPALLALAPSTHQARPFKQHISTPHITPHDTHTHKHNLCTGLPRHDDHGDFVHAPFAPPTPSLLLPGVRHSTALRHLPRATP